MSINQRVIVNTDTQTLAFCQDKDIVQQWAVSTALNGTGNQNGSQQTPLGSHRIRAKIGGSQVINTVFSGRRPTGEVYSDELATQNPARDWVLTRILWLCGNEKGRNRFGKVDSMRRYIYIHGTPDTEPMGQPRSHGCVRMRNKDIIELFDLVTTGMEVMITENQEGI